MIELSRARATKILFCLLSITSIFFVISTIPTTHNSKASPRLHFHKHIQLAHSTCESTLYPDLCVSTLSSFPDLTVRTLPEIISATVKHTVHVIRESASNCSGIQKTVKKIYPIEKQALDDCLELFYSSIPRLQVAYDDLSTKSSRMEHYNDLQTLLSAAITNQYTCLEGFLESNTTNGKVGKLIDKPAHEISQLVSNSLALLKKMPKPKTQTKKLDNQQAFPEYGTMVNGFPRWVSRKDRRLLQSPTNATKFDLVVAKDGSGNFKTIGEAVEAAPNSTTKDRFVIYIKAGAYFENVEVVRKKTKLMFIGDGIGKTVVKGNRNVVDGWTTFRSATVAVVGDGFIARDMTFENYAGASKHQAVALRSGSDLSAFYRCSFVGYQDTLYVHSLRQFYKECDIYGTVDFIFGNAAVVFQNCNLYARKPDPNQKNIYTAQGREDPNQNTGISILNCKITAASDLAPVKTTFKTYLGRPWKLYSRTVFISSFIDDCVDPAGWLEWNGNFALDTLYYGEYRNRGPGANTSARVQWPGYRVINNTAEASQFTATAFIQANEWLASANVPFFPGLV